MNKYLATLYTNIKENITMIALVPTLFGGIWQIIKLGALSSNMIRFFSISQLLSDGILFLLIVVFPIIFIIPIVLSDDEGLQEKSVNYTAAEKIDKDFLHILLYLTGIIFIIFSVFHIPKYITIDSISSLVQCIVCMYIVMGILFYIIYKFFTKDAFLHKLYFCSYTIIISCVTFISYNNISRNFSGISNFDQMINKLEKSACYSKKPEILYFNDKYIFIQLELKSKKSILIKKIDDLFEQ